MPADPRDALALPDLAEIRSARQRIGPHTHRTPVLTCQSIDELVGARLYFKCENFQKTGAFKARGACSAFFALPSELARKGAVTQSSGNHGAAVAYAASLRGAAAWIVMPDNAAKSKIANVERFGAKIVFCSPSLEVRKATCMDLALRTGGTVVEPSDDVDVIAGQATVAVELLEEIPELDSYIAPVGSGGLLAGSAIAVAALSPRTLVYGAEPAAADDAARSLLTGKIEPMVRPQTMADGLQATLSLRSLRGILGRVRHVGLTSEAGIARATRLIWERMKIVVEPSAAVPLACLMEGAIDVRGQRVGVILTGGNVDGIWHP